MGDWKKQVADSKVESWADVEELADARVRLTVREKPGAEEATMVADMRTLINRRQWMDAQKKWAEEELARVNSELLLLMNAAEKDKVKLWDGLRLERRTGSTPSKLEPTKLLEQGVTLAQIDEATVKGKQYQFVMITKGQ